MQLRWGYTRIVVLHGRYAFKIAQIRPVRTILKLFIVTISGKHFWRMKSRYHTNLLKAFWIYFWAGLYANRSEVKYWFTTHDKRCVPVVASWWGGLVIVQLRAAEVTIEQVEQSDINHLLKETDLRKVCQYGEYQGKCRVLDYAHWGSRSFKSYGS